MSKHLKTISEMASLALPFGRYVASRVRGGKIPLAVTLSLTNRCNFRCVYCNVPDLAAGEMDTQEWQHCIDELAAAGMIRASVMGGEPLLRKDCGAVIRHLKHRGVHASMNTNGWLVENRIEDVALLDVVCVSIDGPKEVHDTQRRKGSYDRVVRAIELSMSRGVQVVTMTVVTPKSRKTIDFVLQMAKEMGFRAHFHLEHDADCDTNKPISPDIDDAGVADLARLLLQRKDEGYPVGPSRTYLNALASKGRRLHSCSDCFASRYFCHVMPDGIVVPCLLTHRTPGAVSGRDLGYVEALQQLPQPTDAGCSCEPLQEMNMMLGGRPEVVMNAFGLATRG
ncbi:MAG: radical SAM protein [Myxococcota bacterium]